MSEHEQDEQYGQRVEPALVTLTDVAELAGVRRPTVSNWRRRHRSFPRPVAGDDSQPLFDSEEIDAWLRRRPIPGAHFPPFDYGYRFRDGLRLRGLAGLRGVLSGSSLLAAGVALCALRHLTGQSIGDVETAKALAHRFEADRPELEGVLVPDIEALPAAAGGLIRAVDGMCATTPPARVSDQLIREADRMSPGVRADMTPPEITRLVADLVGSIEGRSVYDPAVGSGSLLLGLLSARPSRLVVADTSEPHSRLVRQRLLCRDVPAQVFRQDSLRSEESQLVDLLVLDPPFVGSDLEERAARPSLSAPELTGERDLGSRQVAAGGSAGVRRDRLTRPGDLILLQGESLAVHVDRTGGSAVLFPAQSMRIAASEVEAPWMTPDVLAAILGTTRNAMPGRGPALRVDLRSLELPDLDPEEVAGIDSYLDVLARHRRSVANRLEALDELSGAISRGVAAAALLIE